MQIDVGRDPLAHLDQRLDGREAFVADIDMGADRKQPLRHREVAVAQRPLHHRLDREQRLQFAPERDPFQKRPGPVQPRDPEAERRVHVEMRIDEGRRDKPAGRVDLAGRAGLDRRAQLHDSPIPDRDVDPGPPVRQARVPHHDIEHVPAPVI